MKLSELKSGDTVKFKEYWTGELLIGIFDKVSPHGDYYIYQNTSDTHRRWFKLYPSEIVAKIKYVEEPIEDDTI